uniref:Uncharacterized protein n=1 Tax=Hippocampus comes TaxID=109280 RepID=A0A3Q2YYD9_HIPCM
ERASRGSSARRTPVGATPIKRARGGIRTRRSHLASPAKGRPKSTPRGGGRKLMFETACWEEPEREATPRGGGSNVATSPEADARAEAGVNGPAIFHALVKAELSYSLRNLSPRSIRSDPCTLACLLVVPQHSGKRQTTCNQIKYIFKRKKLQLWKHTVF